MQLVITWNGLVLTAALISYFWFSPSYNNYVFITHCVLCLKIVEWQSSTQCAIISWGNFALFVFSPFLLQ